MAGKLIPLSEAAALLGVSADRLNELRQSNEIYGYRDGASWKFKQDDVERLKETLAGGGSSTGNSGTNLDDLDFALPMGDEKDDLMLAPDFSSSGSDPILGGSEQIRGLAKGDSELTLSSPDKLHSSSNRAASSDVSLASDVIKGLMGSSELVSPSSGTQRMPSLNTAGSADDDDEFVLGSPIDGDSDLTGSKTVLKSGSGLFGSGPIQLGGDNVLDAGGLSSAGASSIGLGDDYDNVLGGSGSGSDITHRPGDSGILLIDPADSGLSLEAPPSLSGTGEGTLDFGGGAEDDFLLKPLDEGGDEDSESGSQVIMLDSEGAFDEKSSTLIADSLPGMPGGMNMDFGSPLGGGALGGGMSGGMAAAPQAVIPPGMVVVPKETPFSMFSVVGLVACTLVLALGGMMMFDVMRNIWSWDTPHSFSSTIMDSLLGRS